MPVTAQTRQETEQGHRFPVARGQVWRAGRHLIACSDLVADTLYDELLAEAPATLVYSDPPWDNRLLKFFRREAEAGEPDHDYLDIYRRIIRLAGELPLYLEIGRPGDQAVAGLLPGPLTRRWQVMYAGSRPYVVHYSGSTPPPYGLDPSGLRSWAVAKAVLEAYPAGTVADPCCGLGGVPMVAAKAGWASVSNELHPRRVSVALSRLNDLGFPVLREE